VGESVIAVHQVAVGGGDENAFLNLLEEQTIFLFRGAALRCVADNVDRALLLAVVVGIGRCRNQRIATEAGIGPLDEINLPARAVRTAFPLLVGLRQNGLAWTAH